MWKDMDNIRSDHGRLGIVLSDQHIDKHLEQHPGNGFQTEILDGLLKAEQMAIHSYEKARANVTDSNLKHQFTAYQEQHRRWLERLNEIRKHHKEASPSLLSQSIVTGMFALDRFLSDNGERNSVQRMRDREELGIKELKKAKHHISNPFGQTILDEMIQEATTRVDALNQEVDRLRRMH
jgi:Domain of unknown function (DUF2383)